jgi:hypothetical protein
VAAAQFAYFGFEKYLQATEQPDEFEGWPALDDAGQGGR